MHHTHTTTPHATPACIPDKTYCKTKLTGCEEGSMTREGNTWRGDIPNEKGRSASAQDGAGLCTTPMPNPSSNQRMRHRQKTSCTTVLTSCDEGTITRDGSTWWGDITQDRIESQQVHKMGQVCAPHPCHNPSRNPRMHCQHNVLDNRTHWL